MCTVQRDPVVRVGWGNDNVIWYFQLLVSISLVLKCSFQLLTGPGTTQLLSTGSRVIKIYPTEKMTKIHFYVDIWWGLVGDLVRCWSPAPTLVTFFYEQLHIWVVNWSTLAVTDTLFILARPHRATPANTGPAPSYNVILSCCDGGWGQGPSLAIKSVKMPNTSIVILSFIPLWTWFAAQWQ